MCTGPLVKYNQYIKDSIKIGQLHKLKKLILRHKILFSTFSFYHLTNPYVESTKKKSIATCKLGKFMGLSEIFEWQIKRFKWLINLTS